MYPTPLPEPASAAGRAPFDRAIALLVGPPGDGFEGIHSNDPEDPGGDTWYGISRRSYPKIPWPPTKEQAIAIYRRDFWEGLGLDALPPKVALIVFDAAVNQGPETAVEMLQGHLGVKIDGDLGPVTAHAAYVAESRTLLERLTIERLYRYGKSKNFNRFGKDWVYRAVRTLTSALVY